MKAILMINGNGEEGVLIFEEQDTFKSTYRILYSLDNVAACQYLGGRGIRKIEGKLDEDKNEKKQHLPLLDTQVILHKKLKKLQSSTI